jgi:hypothetical protein
MFRPIVSGICLIVILFPKRQAITLVNSLHHSIIKKSHLVKVHHSKVNLLSMRGGYWRIDAPYAFSYICILAYFFSNGPPDLSWS